jgi:hypothetical protein
MHFLSFFLLLKDINLRIEGIKYSKKGYRRDINKLKAQSLKNII